MNIIILSIIILIVGIIAIYYANRNYWELDEPEAIEGIGLLLLFVGALGIIITITIVLVKPFDYRTFKIKYNTINQMTISKDDIRDATLTNKLIEINEKINYCREYKDNEWIGIFQNKKICEMELLNKGE